MMKHSALVEINCNSPRLRTVVKYHVINTQTHRDTRAHNFSSAGYLSTPVTWIWRDMLAHLSYYILIYLSLKHAAVIALYKITTCVFPYSKTINRFEINITHIFFPLRACWLQITIQYSMILHLICVCFFYCFLSFQGFWLTWWKALHLKCF